MLTPCMIIDNPHIYRDVVFSCHAYPTHDGADDILVKIPEQIDDYGQNVHSVYDPIWNREKIRYGYSDPENVLEDKKQKELAAS